MAPKNWKKKKAYAQEKDMWVEIAFIFEPTFYPINDTNFE